VRIKAACVMTRYRTIVADPPWHYERTGLTFADAASGNFVGHGLPYSSMPHQAIRDLRVKDMAADNAHLFLWTTQRYLWPAHDIARAWGFEPVKVLVWCKPPTGFSMGGTFGNACEFIVFARRGSGVATGRISRDWWEWPRGQHSAKPEAFLDIVEQVSPGPYVELFARRARFGWDYWGDQSLGTAEMEDVA
jgi:N6-adenosine-specific RNA methylase IME4